MKQGIESGGEPDRRKRYGKGAAVIGVTATAITIGELWYKRHSRHTDEMQAVFEAISIHDRHYPARKRMIAAALEKSCHTYGDLQTISQVYDSSLFEQALLTLTEDDLDEYAFLRKVASGKCNSSGKDYIDRVHYELTEFGAKTWNNGLFEETMRDEITALREELNDNS